MEKFIPDYLNIGEEKNLEIQEKDWASFKEKYHKVRKEAGLE